MRCEPNIPEIVETFPEETINDLRGWGIDAPTLAANKGRLLTLDIDFGDVCSLNCPNCFRKNSVVDTMSERTLTPDDLRRIVLDAKRLGLRSLKFLGAGEPLENPGFIEFLRFLKAEDVIPVIFTKGHVIGDDTLAARHWSHLGITNGRQLITELDACGASLIVGFNSFDDEIQAKLTGTRTDYAQSRNRALELLFEQGFTRSNPTRLALGVNPVTKSNIGEALEIYKWARRRGMYAVVTPTMVSGRARKPATWAAITPTREELVQLYADIYRFNLEIGLQTLEDLRREGISAYAGGHPCNQVATGLYVTLHGVVLSCPGDVNVEGSIWTDDLESIWRSSNNFDRQGLFNNHCPAKDGKSIPVEMYDMIVKSIMGS